MDIPGLIIQNTISRYNLEMNYSDNEDDINDIKKIIEKLQKPLQNKVDTFNNKINELDRLTMKKQFYRLKKQQKFNLIKEYYKSKNIEDDRLENFAENIMELLENSTLKNKDIEYDMENIKIINIDKMIIENGELKFVKSAKNVKTTKKESIVIKSDKS